MPTPNAAQIKAARPSTVARHRPTSTPIVFIAGRNPLNGRGGLETYVRTHAHAASRAGFDAHVFCLARGSRVLAADFGQIHDVATPVRPLASFMAPLHLPFITRAVIDHFKDADYRGPLIVHSFGALSFIGAAVCRSLATLGIEAVPVASAYTTLRHENEGILGGMRGSHDPINLTRYLTRYLWVRTIADRYERCGYAASRLVLVNYDSVRALLTEQYGRELATRRIPYASDLAFMPRDDSASSPGAVARLRPAQAPLVLSVSRHDPRKGVDVLLRSLARCREAGVPFRATLVGTGPTLSADRALLKRLGLDAHVVITGHVPDVRPYLEHADVFVMPSREEGGGALAMLEALQAGLPIIATRCDGLPEDLAIDDSHAGLLVDPGNERELADALGRLLTDAMLRESLGERARLVYERRFSAEAFVEALRDTYAELGVSNDSSETLQ
jgi:glycosyltransferase involved in cell wall biosynthesis